MKKYKYLLVLIAILGFNGCEEYDKLENQVKNEVNRIKEKYEEYRGEGKEDEPKPFTVVYQANENDKQVLLSSACGANQGVKYTYYQTPADTIRVLDDTYSLISYPGNQKPFWDIRYIDPVTAYMNGGTYDQYPNHGQFSGLDTRSGVRNIGIGTPASQVEAGGSITQSECVNGLLTGGVIINLNDAPNQYIYYGGPQSTFTYKLGKSSLSNPWKANGTGNLVLQASFDTPLYFNYEENIGGGVYFSLFLKNRKNGKVLNYIIGIYATGDAWVKEKRGIQFDPTTNFVHVATVISDNSWWSTKSPSSLPLQEIFNTPNKTTLDDQKWGNFFRVNVEYKNLLVLLQELRDTPPAGAEGQDFGLNPEDWDVTAALIQYELEEEGGKATFAGSFTGFEAYVSNGPI